MTVLMNEHKLRNVHESDNTAVENGKNLRKTREVNSAGF